MYINKPSATKIEAAERDNLLHNTMNSGNHETLVKYLYPCLDIHHFMIITKKTLAFTHTNETLDNFIKIELILEQLCMWLVQVVSVTRQLSV